MSYNLIGRSANDTTVVDATCDIIPNYARVDFSGGFCRGYGADVDDGADEARGVPNSGDVGPEIIGCHCW